MLTTRRDFLKRTGYGLAGAAILPTTGRPQDRDAAVARPPARHGMLVPGVHGYAATSVTAGETISFRISGTVPYRLSIHRLGPHADDTVGDELLHRFPESAPTPQPIFPGSSIWIPKHLAGPVTALSLECWVRPAIVKARAGLITQYGEDDAVDFALLLAPDGRVSFLLAESAADGGAGALESDATLARNRWTHVVATWDGREKSLWLDGRLSGRSAADAKAIRGHGILRLAAGGRAGLTSAALDGDLATPAIYGRALSAAEIVARHGQRGLEPAAGPNVLACWPFAEEQGDRVADVSGHGREGRIVNHATWMIGGPSFAADVPRYGSYEPRADPLRGHGLRFASDDLYDCGWNVTHDYLVPPTCVPGLYVGRIEYTWEARPHRYHITFIVKRAARRAKAPILVLAATNTWRAYNAAAFAKPNPALLRNCGTQGLPNSPGDPPAFSFYRAHAGGQGTYQQGLNMPLMSGDPYLLYGKEYSHLVRADRFAQIWLEREGYAFDVISDLDLHRDPEILLGYQTIVINGHSEYWSLPAYHGLENYLRKNGNVVVLSGNSLFWRVSFNADCSVLECRKADAPGTQVPARQRGETWHSDDGLRGGLMRECGFPGWKLIGLETLGWFSEPLFGPYVVEEAGHGLFTHPEKVGLARGETFGQMADGKFPRASGHEIDVRVSTLATLQENPAPAGTVAPGDPAGIVRIASGVTDWSKGGSAFDYFFRPIKPTTPLAAEMIYWERPEGGKVFNAGSIGAGWALHADPRFQALMRNVLAHFGVAGRPAKSSPP